MKIQRDNNPKIKIFLGGTCNESTWRKNVIDVLTRNDIKYFNPVVDNWTEECYQKELEERNTCSHCLYVITPKMTGTYSIAEAVDDSNKRPEKTLFHFMTQDDKYSFDEGQLKSLDKVGILIENNGGKYFRRLQDLYDYIEAMR